MGISPGWLDQFIGWADEGHIKSGASILDIGASELFCASDPDSISRFTCRFGGVPYTNGELEKAADRSFAADLFRRSGFTYRAIDYAKFPNIIRLDLNRKGLPWRHWLRYDLVTNSGTSEHILNQFNVFKIIHDATAVGGVMYHGVPSFGECAHGIINYSPKFFWSLAKANHYEIIRYWGWADSEVRTVGDHLNGIDFNTVPETRSVWLHILLRKRFPLPFQGLTDPAFSRDATSPDR